MIFKDLAKKVDTKPWFFSFNFFSVFLIFSFLYTLIRKNLLLILFILINIIIIKGAFLSNSPQFAELSSSISHIAIK